MKKLLVFTAVILGAFLYQTSCYAVLVDRGSGLIYDDVQNLTWLQDANYAHTSGYAEALYGYDTNGGLTHDDAMKWADALVYIDQKTGVAYDDWRLPKIFVEEGGWNNESEMGKLYYIGLNNVAKDLTPNMGPFTNIQPYWYRTSNDAEGGTMDWAFRFKGAADDWDVSGYQATADKSVPEAFAWAVRDGDVVVTPEPSSCVLFGLGGAAMAFRRFRQKLT